jgi:hypothetical protein
MQSELKSLSKIFSECIFRIPDYQRGYSWEQKHLKDFWNDIEQLPEGKNHYTGVLTLEPVARELYERWDDDLWIIQAKRYSPLYVVDGQQRLTTAIVLLESILESIPDEAELNYTSKAEIRKKYIFESRDQGISRSYIFGYEKDNPSYEYLKQEIFGEQSEEHAPPETTIYTKNLGVAKSYFLEDLKKLTLPEIEAIFTKLTQHLLFNIFYIEPDLDVFVTFETMNNRGKALSHLELLKNRLIYLSTRFSDDKSERERLRKTVNESWKTIYHFLGKVKTGRLLDDAFLQVHFVCYFGPSLPKRKPNDHSPDYVYDVRRYMGPDEIYKDYLLENVFTPNRLSAKEEPLTVEEIHKFSLSIKSAVRTYYEVIEPDDSSWSDPEKMCLSQIRRLSNFGLILFSVAAMIHCAEDGARNTLLSALERMGFLSRIRAYYFSDVVPERLAIALVSDSKTSPEIARELEAASDKFAGSSEFHEALRGIGKASGYYGWGALRYFMFEYEQHLRMLSKTSRELLTWEHYRREDFDTDHKTIEHIYPQRALDTYWKRMFEKYSISEKNILRNSLGNLLPVSHPKNASLSNKNFESKKGSRENQVGYRYGCLSEIQVAQESDWGAIEILRRGVALLEFMERRWRVQLGNAAAKVEVLGLSFVPSKEGVTLQRILEKHLPVPTVDPLPDSPQPPRRVKRIRS